MPCIDHDYKNCPSYMELGTGEHCKIAQCQRIKDVQNDSGSAFEMSRDELEDVVIAGKTGGRHGTI